MSVTVSRLRARGLLPDAGLHLTPRRLFVTARVRGVKLKTHSVADSPEPVRCSRRVSNLVHARQRLRLLLQCRRRVSDACYAAHAFRRSGMTRWCSIKRRTRNSSC